MALAIKSIPTLHGEAAERFLKMAESSEKSPKIDFSKEIEQGRAILRKANL
ncbi:MAG: hypothetical protein LIP02_02640 [Bacteroidales bacterium]|nr:hypothetical protein [Bacteroidales bacterium]